MTARPRQVTVAAWLIMIGSVAVVATVYDEIERLHSLSTRDQVTKMLDSGIGKSLNLSVEDMLSIMHTLAMVAAGCATACVILGWHLLRRSAPARIAVTVVAVPLWITGLASDGLFSTLVAVAVATLWFQPARSWFSPSPVGDGVGDSRSASDPHGAHGLPGTRRVDSVAAPAAASVSAPRGSDADRESPTPGSDEGRNRLLDTGRVEPVLYGRVVEDARPRTLVWALVLTWVFSGLAALLMVIAAAAVLADPQGVLDRMTSMDPTLTADGIDQNSVRAIVVVLAVVVVSWCVASTVLALMLWRRVRFAHPLLVACISLCALIQLFAVFGNPVVIISLVAAVIALRLLLRPEVRAWLSSRP